MATTWTPVSTSAPLVPTSDDNWALLPPLQKTMADITALNATHVLGITTEDTFCHQIAFSSQGVSTAGTIRVWFAPSGTALASGTALTAAEDLSGGSWAANSVGTVTVTNGTTRIPAGSIVGFVASAATVVTNFVVNVVLRKATGCRTNDAGEKYYEYNGQQVM